MGCSSQLHFFFIAHAWICKPGRGQYGKQIDEVQGTNLENCKKQCLNKSDCLAIDYTDTDPKYSGEPSCRRFGVNLVRSDPGVNNRVYCSNEKIGEERIDTLIAYNWKHLV